MGVCEKVRQCSGADLGGGGRGSGSPLTLNFEAQIFAATATPLRDVGKNLAWASLQNPGSALHACTGEETTAERTV